MKHVFLSAFRNEAGIIEEFLAEFAPMVEAAGIADRTTLTLVDDDSTDDTCARIERFVLEKKPRCRIEVIPAPTNLGNQGAMFFGLRRIEIAPDDVLVTFDCDGEDDVREVRSILELGRANPGKVVLIERGRRNESLRFKLFFAVYKLLFRFLSGKRVVPNNFMLIPGKFVPAIRNAPLAAAHLAYGVLRLAPPNVVTSRDRRPRYGGQTSQSLFMLVSHGMVGLMVFYEVVVAKLFMLAFALGVVDTGLAAAWLFVPPEYPHVRTGVLASAAGPAIAAVALIALLLSAAFALGFKLAAFNLAAGSWTAGGERPGAPTPPGAGAASPSSGAPPA
jgi:hypothetical protein